MRIEASEEPIAVLAEYACIPIAYEVNEVFDIAADRSKSAECRLLKRSIAMPYVKDYDGISREGPMEWEQRFDISNWGLIVARVDFACVGGATIAYDTPGLDMLEGRSDLAVLWDIRVAPAMRRRGVGTALFKAAETWALARGCRHLKVETQNINIAACRFYAGQECMLGAAHRGAYSEFPDEMGASLKCRRDFIGFLREI